MYCTSCVIYYSTICGFTVRIKSEEEKAEAKKTQDIATSTMDLLTSDRPASDIRLVQLETCSWLYFLVDIVSSCVRGTFQGL